MKKKEIQEKIDKLELELVPLRVEYDKIGKKIVSRCNKIDRLQEQLDKKFVMKEKKFSLDSDKKSIDWNVVLDASKEKSSDFYDRSKELVSQKLFGLKHAGCHNTDTFQDILDIVIDANYTDKQLKEIEKNIEFIIKYMKPVHDMRLGQGQDPEDAYYFSIFEHTFSEYVSYSFVISRDKKTCSVNASRYSESGKLSSIIDGLKYIRRNHWHQGGEDKNDDCCV